MLIPGYKYWGYSQSFRRKATGLHLAALFGLLHLSKELLLRFAEGRLIKADSRDGDGRTPLWWAAALGHEEVVKLLVERDDVEADSKNRDGLTPLSWAAAGGHEAVVKLLKSKLTC
jgi:ankyrin repeat protein